MRKIQRKFSFTLQWLIFSETKGKEERGGIKKMKRYKKKKKEGKKLLFITPSRRLCSSLT